MEKNKNLIDQEIQQALDNKRGSLEGTQQFEGYSEIEDYKALFEKLDTPFEINLGSDFSDTVVHAADRKKRIRDISWKVALYIGISIPLVALSILIALAMEPDVFWTMIRALKNSSAYIIFGIALFTIIQVLDKKIVRSKIPEMKA